jgi:hypothetical protein
LNDIGRNLLPGNRQKIAKCLMRTFTCRSTFLYGLNKAAAMAPSSYYLVSSTSAYPL